ncbi:MAG: thiamine diphosphokinase [Clostridia bacterium]|nr:thiamine diphosphokinase [Clostridia bacterium]
MKAFIYAGGEIFPDGIFDFPKGDDVTVSADCGYKNAKLLGIVPQFAVGDFDSETQNEIPRETEIIEVPAEKDFTDTALAVDVALEQGADFIYIIGGLGGRLDHTMANLALLEKLWGLGVRAYITDGKSRARYIERTSELVPRAGFKYISLIATDKEAKGVSIDGCKYPLKNFKLTRTNNALTTSNEILKNCALINVKKGGLYIIESND